MTTRRAVLALLVFILGATVVAMRRPVVSEDDGLVIDLSALSEQGVESFSGPLRIKRFGTVLIDQPWFCEPCHYIELEAPNPASDPAGGTEIRVYVKIPDHAPPLALGEGDLVYAWLFAEQPFWWNYQMYLQRLEAGKPGRLILAAWSVDRLELEPWQIGNVTLTMKADSRLPFASQCGLFHAESIEVASSDGKSRVRSGDEAEHDGLWMWNASSYRVLRPLCSDMGDGHSSGLIVAR